MTRNDLKKLSEKRLLEAKHLIDLGLYDGGYYLSGYCIECALKACIAKKTQKNTFPDKTFAFNVFTHDLNQLLKYAELKQDFDRDANKNLILKANWNVVKDWSETKRYEFSTEQEAKDLYEAIANKQNGILKWLRKHW